MSLSSQEPFNDTTARELAFSIAGQVVNSNPELLAEDRSLASEVSNAADFGYGSTEEVGLVVCHPSVAETISARREYDTRISAKLLSSSEFNVSILHGLAAANRRQRTGAAR
jgi:hypothetical protein